MAAFSLANRWASALAKECRYFTCSISCSRLCAYSAFRSRCRLRSGQNSYHAGGFTHGCSGSYFCAW